MIQEKYLVKLKESIVQPLGIIQCSKQVNISFLHFTPYFVNIVAEKSGRVDADNKFSLT